MNDEHYIEGIEATGDAYVYLVPSDENPRVKYRVDCAANGGAMFCQCRDFAIKRQPRIDRGDKPVTPQSVCKHCQTLIFALARQRFKELAQTEKEI